MELTYKTLKQRKKNRIKTTNSVTLLDFFFSVYCRLRFYKLQFQWRSLVISVLKNQIIQNGTKMKKIWWYFYLFLGFACDFYKSWDWQIYCNYSLTTTQCDCFASDVWTSFLCCRPFERQNSSSLPWCCALTQWGGLRDLVTPRAMTAGAYHSWLVQLCQIGLRERGQTKQHSGPPGWGFSAGLTTLSCKTPHVEPH